MCSYIFAGILFLIAIEGNRASFTTCPDVWVAYKGSCYWFAARHNSSFTEAEHYCRQHFNSHLVHIDSITENNFVKDFVKRLGGENWWIGASDEGVEGNWEWYDTNTPLTVTDWYPGRPDNYNNNEDCAILQSNHDFHWDDVPCSSTYEPICELKSEDVVSVGK